MPHELNVLALDNPRMFYDLLLTASAQTLLKVARDPKHLGAEIGVISILHTWGQNLLLHPHIHCAIPAGGLSPDHNRWIRPRYPFVLPVKVLGRVFRGKFCAGLRRLYRKRQLRCEGPATALSDPKQFRRLLRMLHRQDWVVYAKPAFGGPLKVLRYPFDPAVRHSPEAQLPHLRKFAQSFESGGNILTYSFAIAEDDPRGSVWWLQFYGKPLFMILTDVKADNEVAS